MATLKMHLSSGPRRYAPALGESEEFEALFRPIWEQRKKDGFEGVDAEPIRTKAAEMGMAEAPDGLPVIEWAAREVIAEALTKYQGKTFTGTPAGPITSDEPEIAPQIEPMELRIPARNGEPYWYDDPDDARFLEHMILSRRALGNALHGGVLITGPAGVGKTQSVSQAVRRINEREQLSLRLTKMDCAVVSDPQKWFGRREVIDGDTKYVKSDFIEAVERGDVLLLDDFNRIHPTIANPIFALLDGSQSLHLSDLNVVIAVNPETCFIATINEGVQYGGTHRMDWAMSERFPFRIERGFPPRDEEVRVITSHTNCDQDGAANLVMIAQKTRDMFEAGDLRAQVSTRVLVAAGWLVASGMGEGEALARTALGLFDGDANGLVGQESDRMKVKMVISGRIRK